MVVLPAGLFDQFTLDLAGPRSSRSLPLPVSDTASAKIIPKLADDLGCVGRVGRYNDPSMAAQITGTPDEQRAEGRFFSSGSGLMLSLSESVS